ncbi:hypothetical protein M422DRAFT_49472 [Sphaerobolus stellatus SS14]|uniref:Uncharacterized protein n=1 Tax=Sphaerobolus stellatus (strain SS14) TaxID=990650 RepID=A0A0C9UYP6_SPHS4|nr:hypothetical protein M422DRAFT_49472 [Sphaerobolus stellatus SS14]
MIDTARIEDANDLATEKEEIAQHRKEVREQVKKIRKKLEEKASLCSKTKKKISATTHQSKALNSIPHVPSSSASCSTPHASSLKLAVFLLTPPHTPSMVKPSEKKCKRDTVEPEVIDLTADDVDSLSMPKRCKVKHRTLIFQMTLSLLINHHL